MMPNLVEAAQHFVSPVPPSIAWYAFSLRKGLGSPRSAKNRCTMYELESSAAAQPSTVASAAALRRTVTALMATTA